MISAKSLKSIVANTKKSAAMRGVLNELGNMLQEEAKKGKSEATFGLPRPDTSRAFAEAVVLELGLHGFEVMWDELETEYVFEVSWA